MSQLQAIIQTIGVQVSACFRGNEGGDESVERKYNRSEEGVSGSVVAAAISLHEKPYGPTHMTWVAGLSLSLSLSLSLFEKSEVSVI